MLENLCLPIHIFIFSIVANQLLDSCTCSVAVGIVLFLLVEKVVRYVEDLSGKGAHAWGHGHHHHHHHKSGNQLKDDGPGCDDPNATLIKANNGNVSEMASDTNLLDGVSDDCLSDEKHSSETILHKVL